MSRITPIFNSFYTVAKPYNQMASQFVRTDKYASEVNKKTKLSTIASPIKAALEELETVEFSEKDIKYLKSLGVEINFNSGKDAIDFINKQNLKIKFYNLEDKSIFAQFDGKNTIRINETYKNTGNRAEILAISEAILHEAGHAKHNKSLNSIQDEMNNLALNVLAHRFYLKKFPYIFDTSNSKIVQDGVNVYADLFFDPDPNKLALIKRLREKYGALPAGSKNNQPSIIAQRVKDCNA